MVILLSLSLCLSLSLSLCRKYTLLFNNIIVLVGIALQSFAVHPAMFIVGRFVIGVNSGTCL